jgi:hypothetical protein
MHWWLVAEAWLFSMSIKRGQPSMRLAETSATERPAFAARHQHPA